MVLDAVKERTGTSPAQMLADTELVIALGRGGKTLAKPRDAQRYPDLKGG